MTQRDGPGRQDGEQGGTDGQDGQDGQDDLKARMREALARKQANDRGVPQAGRLREKAHGSEVAGGAAPKMHRRKAGGGGS